MAEIVASSHLVLARKWRPDRFGELVGQETTRIVRCQDWLESLAAGSIVTGPGLTKLHERLPAGVGLVDAPLWLPAAATIGRVGWRSFSAGQRDDVFDLVPRYFRRTAAEEQWDRKQTP